MIEPLRRALLASAAALALALPVSAEDAPALPVTGPDAPGLEAFDETMLEFMRARSVPAGSLAIVKDGRLIYARGFGHLDAERTRPCPPDALFRIASISKPITAVAVLSLLEEEGCPIGIDEAVFPFLGYEPVLADGAKADPRIGTITVRHLLQHTGGFDRAKSGDPMFRPIAIADATGTEPPAGPEAIIRYVTGRPLDFDPGDRSAYSNFGYCALGRLVEKLSGMPYERYVRSRILAPLGVGRMRIGATGLEGRAPKEVFYSDPAEGRSVFGPDLPKVPVCYGGFYLEAMDSHGGWIASAVDLVRFARAFDDPERCPVLTEGSVQTMFARPKGSAGYEDGKPKAAYYACGWMVRPVGGGRANHWHNGSLPGTSTLLVRRADGLIWAALFDQRRDPSGLGYGEIDGALHRAAARVERWPDRDLEEGFFRDVGRF